MDNTYKARDVKTPPAPENTVNYEFLRAFDHSMKFHDDILNS